MSRSGPSAAVVAGRPRPATIEDAEALHALDATCFPDPWPVSGWRLELRAPARAWRVVQADGELVAAGGLWFAPDVAHLLRLAVAPAWRRRGLASRLIELLVALTRDARRDALTLEVRASNAPAASLYRRHGFVRQGIRPGYYADGEDAVLLTRRVAVGAPRTDDR